MIFRTIRLRPFGKRQQFIDGETLDVEFPAVHHVFDVLVIAFARMPACFALALNLVQGDRRRDRNVETLDESVHRKKYIFIGDLENFVVAAMLVSHDDDPGLRPVYLSKIDGIAREMRSRRSCIHDFLNFSISPKNHRNPSRATQRSEPRVTSEFTTSPQDRDAR